VFLVGSALTLAAPFVWIMVPNNTSICLGRLWLTSLGLIIILGTMFSRTWQLREIYKLSKMPTHTMTTLRKNLSLNNSMKKLAMTLSSIFLLDLILLIFWTTFDTWTATLVPTDPLNFEAKWHCYSHKTYIWMSVQTLGIFAILLWGLFVIYQTWSFHQKSMLRETRWVLLTLYNVVLNFAVLLPLLSLGGWDDDQQTVGVVMSLEFSAGGIILANLLPKALSTWKHKQEHNSKSSVHGKGGSMDSSGQGLVKLDVSVRGMSGSLGGAISSPSHKKDPPTPKDRDKGSNEKKKAKLNADELDMQKEKNDSPTLLGMYKLANRGGSPENQNGQERTEDESQVYGGENSLSSRLTEVQIRNDSLVQLDGRPESPPSLPRLFDQEDFSATSQKDEKRAHPSEPTIIEEEKEEEPSPRETTPLRKFRRLITENEPVQAIRKTISTQDPRALLTAIPSTDNTPIVSKTFQTDSPPVLRKNSLSDLDVY